MNVGTCRSCGKGVLWVETEAGKRMPPDLDPVPDGNIVTTRAGRVRYLTKGEPFAGERFRSHFASCPHARTWRKS